MLVKVSRSIPPWHISKISMTQDHLSSMYDELSDSHMLVVIGQHGC